MTAQTIPADREPEVVALVTRGLSDREIAEALVLSPRTIDHYLRVLRHRHGVRTSKELVAALVALPLLERATRAEATLLERTRERDQCRRDLAALDRRRRDQGAGR